MKKQAVIVVDLQKEYSSDGKLPLVNIEQAVQNAARIIADAREKNFLVIHVRHEFNNPSFEFFVPGTAGVDFIPEVEPQDDEKVILKNYPNSFLKTDLKEILDENGIEEVVVIGAMSHMCVDATVRAASDFGYKVTVVHDACATRDLEFDGQVVQAAQVHTAMMSALGFAYAKIVTRDEYLAESALKGI